MAQKLKRLELTRIDLVDKGANPGARVQLFKRDEAMKQPTIEELQAQLATVTAERDGLKTAAENVEKADKDELEALRKRDQENKDRIAKLEEKSDRDAAVRKAAEFKDLGTADDLSSVLYDLKKHLPAETYTKTEALFKSWNEQIQKGGVFGEIGRSGSDPVDPEIKLDKMATEHQEKHPKLSYEQAYAEVLKTSVGKRLYKEINDATRGK